MRAVLLSILLLCAPLPLVRAHDGGMPAFFESWEGASVAGWTIESGAGGHALDCTAATDGDCSLLLAPPCCGDALWLRLARQTHVPLDETTVFSFDFQGSLTSGDRDASVRLVFDESAFNIEFTDRGSNGNNGVSLVAPDGERASGPVWPRASTWYHLDVAIHGSNETAVATLSTIHGAPLGSTEWISFRGSVLTAVVVESVTWGPLGLPTVVSLDRLRVD